MSDDQDESWFAHGQEKSPDVDAQLSFKQHCALGQRHKDMLRRPGRPSRIVGVGLALSIAILSLVVVCSSPVLLVASGLASSSSTLLSSSPTIVRSKNLVYMSSRSLAFQPGLAACRTLLNTIRPHYGSRPSVNLSAPCLLLSALQSTAIPCLAKSCLVSVADTSNLQHSRSV